MRCLFILFLVVLLRPDCGNAQPPDLCTVLWPEPAEDCFNTCVACNFTALPGNTGGYGAGFVPQFCSNIQNDQWYAFVAGIPEMEITITPSNCFNGAGIQAALYEECDGMFISCDPGCMTCANDPVEMQLTNLIPGKTYYLMIDGYSGDVCDFILNVFPPSAAVAPPVGSMSNNINGPAATCNGAGNTYTIPVVSGAGYYTWSSNSPATLFNGQPGPATFAAPGGNVVDVVFGSNAGAVAISVQASNACNTGQTRTRVIQINGGITLSQDTTVTTEELPFTLPWGALAQTPGLYSFQVSGGGNSCDSLIDLTLHVEQAQALVTVYTDTNENGIRDAGEPSVAETPVRFGNVVRKTNVAGQIFGYGMTAGDTISLILPGMTLSNPLFAVFNPAVFEYAFGVPPFSFCDIEVDVTANSVFRTGFHTTITATVKNNSNTDFQNVPVAVVMSHITVLLSALPSGYIKSGDTLNWVISSLPAQSTSQFIIKVITNAGFSLGTPIVFTASVPVQSCETYVSNNISILNQPLVGSYDPNDKTVSPAWILPEQWDDRPRLTYTIRFQNTGNYPAETVVLIDTLSEMLNPATFKMISSSHPCEWVIRNSGRILEVKFSDIMLPDSVSNEPESHGFFKFSIRPAGELSIGQSLENDCDIYFDFNPPIRTNSASSTAVFFVPDHLPVASHTTENFSIRPNPAFAEIKCSWEVPLSDPGSLWIINANGLPVLHKVVKSGATFASADLAQMAPGTYIVRLEAPGVLNVRSFSVVRSIMRE